MSDYIPKLSPVQIGLRVGFAGVATLVVIVGSFFFTRYLAGNH